MKTQEYLNAEKELNKKTADYKNNAELINVLLTLITIVLMAPLMAEVLKNLDLVIEGKNVIEIIFKESPYLQYFFYVGIATLMMQALTHAITLNRINNLKNNLKRLTQDSPVENQ